MINKILQTTKSSTSNSFKNEIRITGRVRGHHFDLVADPSGQHMQVEWEKTIPRNKTRAWFNEYVQERNRLLQVLVGILDLEIAMTTLIHGAPTYVHVLSPSKKGVPHA